MVKMDIFREDTTFRIFKIPINYTTKFYFLSFLKIDFQLDSKKYIYTNYLKKKRLLFVSFISKFEL